MRDSSSQGLVVKDLSADGMPDGSLTTGGWADDGAPTGAAFAHAATLSGPPVRVIPSPRPVPQALEAVHAGFPSVAQDYFNGDFSLDENLVAHPDTTFAVTVAGDSMIGCGIFDGDILLVDRSLTPQNHDIVIATVSGELTVKRLIVRPDGTTVLHPENPIYPDIALDGDGDTDGTMLWGVVIGNYHWQCNRAQYGKVRGTAHGTPRGRQTHGGGAHHERQW